jgi:hypothetical protein
MKAMILRVSIVLAALCIAACTGTVTMTIAAVVGSAQVTFPAVAIEARLDPATTAAVNAYLSGLQTAVTATAKIQASGASPAVQDAEIVAAFAAAAEPTLPVGTTAAVVAIVDTVETAVATFVSAYQAGADSPAAVRAVAPRARPTVNTPITFKVPANDWQHLPRGMKGK